MYLACIKWIFHPTVTVFFPGLGPAVSHQFSAGNVRKADMHTYDAASTTNSIWKLGGSRLKVQNSMGTRLAPSGSAARVETRLLLFKFNRPYISAPSTPAERGFPPHAKRVCYETDIVFPLNSIRYWQGSRRPPECPQRGYTGKSWILAVYVRHFWGRLCPSSGRVSQNLAQNVLPAGI